MQENDSKFMADFNKMEENKYEIHVFFEMHLSAYRPCAMPQSPNGLDPL
jgi:hypothetical protein